MFFKHDIHLNRVSLSNTIQEIRNLLDAVEQLSHQSFNLDDHVLIFLVSDETSRRRTKYHFRRMRFVVS